MFIVQIASSDGKQSLLSDSALQGLFPAAVLEAGRVYEMRGRVRDFSFSRDGLNITATTQGSAAEPYVQQIRLHPRPYHALRISGECSCPVRFGCKHQAAVLIAVARQQSLATIEHAAPAGRPAPEPLPYAVTNWLKELDEHGQDTEDFPPDVRKRLVYVLSAAVSDGGQPRLLIQPTTISLRKDDGVGSSKPYARHQVNAPARYLRPSDRLIMARIHDRGYGPNDDDPTGTLRRIIATGRAVWGSLDGKPVREGPAEPGQLAWRLTPDGSQHPVLVVRDGLVAFRMPDPWYANPETGEIGLLAFGVPVGSVRRLLAAPPISAEYATRIRTELATRLPNLGVPLPEPVPDPERVSGPPTPRLRLLDGTLPGNPSIGRGGSVRRVGNGLYGVPLARLSFGYGPLTLPWKEEKPKRIVVQDGKIYEPIRDPKAEAASVDRLAALGFGRVSRLVQVYYRHAHTDDFALLDGDADMDWLSLLTREVPRLREEGWEVEIDSDFPIQVIEPDGGFDAELIEGSGIDWLELHLGVQVGSERVDVVPALLRFISSSDAAAQLTRLQADQPFVLPLPDGRLLSLPLERILPMLEALLELYAGGVVDPDSAKISFSRLDAADLARFEAASGASWQGGEALRALGRQLREAGGAIPAVSVPDSFKGALRPYQTEGVNWLQFLRGAELGGILADDMGLGKTVQTLAHLLIEQAAGRLDRPALIVCPTSLVPNWTLEAARFAPTLKVLPLHGPARASRFGEIAAHDLVLSTYPLLSRDHEVLTGQEWHTVILDEAQMIKNPNAETTRQALRMKTQQRICLSGTPLQNHLGELWSLFDFLAPGFLGNQKAFRLRYRTPIEKRGDAACLERLTRRVRPFLLRRTKDEVVRELPEKTEITEPVEMEPAQRAIYESIRLAMHKRVRAAIAARGLARSGIIILDALLKLRQACCDPRLLKLQATQRAKAGSAKLDRLMEMLGVMRDEGRRVLLFSQFTEMLALIEHRLRGEAVDYVLLTGDTKDRATPVAKFQAGETPLFLISLKAGGVGLNLTAADTVIHYDPWWNPAVEDQATDRAHRIGQTRNVFVHRLVAIGTIEEKMEVLKEKKRALVASVLEAEHGGALKLTEADVEALFSPA